jgi:hypothetical protein
LSCPGLIVIYMRFTTPNPERHLIVALEKGSSLFMRAPILQ